MPMDMEFACTGASRPSIAPAPATRPGLKVASTLLQQMLAMSRCRSVSYDNCFRAPRRRFANFDVDR